VILRVRKGCTSSPGKLNDYDGGTIVCHHDFEVMKNDAAAEGIPSRRLPNR
jgi:hypothetical protein